MRVPHASALSLFGLLFLAACTAEPRPRAPEPVGQATLTSASLDVSVRLAEAACDRRGGMCGGFATYDDCVRLTAPVAAEKTKLASCTHFVAAPSASACAAEIRVSACGVDISTLKACQPQALCPPVTAD